MVKHMRRRFVIGVMGAGDRARESDIALAYGLGAAIAGKGWILLSGGRNTGVMDAVNRGARSAGGLTIGILPDNTRSAASEAVDVAVVTGLGSARNYINVLSSDVVVSCGAGGAGTASEVALALKAGKPVVLLKDRPESKAFFAAIGSDLVQTAESLADAIKLIDLALQGISK
jgi:uncharacterized protein (TIGR00725 family)